MTGEINGFTEQDDQNDGPFKNPDINQEIKSLIGPAVAESVSQYHGLLRQGLELEVKRIINDFETATADIESTVARRVKARLHELVEQEVRNVFNNALSNAEDQLFVDPFSDKNDSWKPNASASANQNGSAPKHDAPHKPHDESAHADDEIDGSDRGDWGGDGASDWPPEPISPPSSHVAPGFESAPNEREPEAVARASQPQMTHESEQLEDQFENNIAEDSLDDDSTIISDDEVFEGTVRLNVEASESIKHVVNFVRELRQKPQLRLLRLVGNNREGVDIWLGLREPTTLQKMIPKLEGVNIISTSLSQSLVGNERRLSVRLVTMAALPPKDATWGEPSTVSNSNQVIA